MNIRKDKTPVIIYEDDAYTTRQKTVLGIDHCDFVHIEKGKDIPQQDTNNIRDSGIYTKDIGLTLKYRQFKKLQEEKENILPLLRQAISDMDLPDMNHFPIGSFDTTGGEPLQDFENTTGRFAFIRWIRRLNDYKAVPNLEKILYEEYQGWSCNSTYTVIKNSGSIKDQAIKTLAKFGEKKILIDRLLSDEKIKNSQIKEILLGLRGIGMKDSDLPLLEKLCEKYESHDTENRYIDSLQLNKLLGSNIGLIGCEFKNGHLMERDIEERHPIQRVLLKTIASIGSLKALDFLENMMQRTLYEEFELFCVCAIRYRTFLNTEKIKQGISSIPPRVMKRMYDQYVYIPMIRMSNTLKTNKMSAWTDKVDREREERRRMENKAEKEARKKAKKEYVRKNSAYLESLHIGDAVAVTSTGCYLGGDMPGKVISKDENHIVIESEFLNKKKIGRRKFSMETGYSTRVAFMSEDDYGDTIPIRFVICEPPKPEEENKKERVPQKIPIHIFGKENDPGEELPF